MTILVTSTALIAFSMLIFLNGSKEPKKMALYSLVISSWAIWGLLAYIVWRMVK